MKTSNYKIFKTQFSYYRCQSLFLYNIILLLAYEMP